MKEMMYRDRILRIWRVGTLEGHICSYCGRRIEQEDHFLTSMGWSCTECAEGDEYEHPDPLPPMSVPAEICVDAPD